jgi:hypothetical protein
MVCIQVFLASSCLGGSLLLLFSRFLTRVPVPAFAQSGACAIAMPVVRTCPRPLGRPFSGARFLSKGLQRMLTWPNRCWSLIRRYSHTDRAIRWCVTLIKVALVVGAAACLSIFLPELYAEREDPRREAPLSIEATKLVGKWELFEAKEPGQPYRPSLRGRAFSPNGPEAFALVVEYRADGTFCRVTREGEKQRIEQGTWTLEGHELRLISPRGVTQAVVYVRLDQPDRFTAIEVHEETLEPGLFVRFRRVEGPT